MNPRLITILIFFTFMETQAQTILGTFTDYWAETRWTFEFSKDNTFTRTSNGHFGYTVISGKYKINADTIILVWGNKNTVENEIRYYLLIAGDSCIINTKMKYDYYKTRPEEIVKDEQSWLAYENYTQPNKSISGQYRLKYYPKLDNGTGWDYNQIQREELLTINADSTYRIERIYPQGGFEVKPDTGKWELNNSTILLKSSILNQTRIFEIKSEGLVEPNSEDFSTILWTRE